MWNEISLFEIYNLFDDIRAAASDTSITHRRKEILYSPNVAPSYT